MLTTWLDQQTHTVKHAADGVRQVLAALAHLTVSMAATRAWPRPRDGAMVYFTKRVGQVQ